MKFSHPHTLAKDDARRRIETLLKNWQAKYGVTVNWSGDSAKVKGGVDIGVKKVEIEASLTIEATSVEAEGTDPGMLLRAAATGYLKKKLQDYLDPAKTEADLQKLA